MEMIEVGGLRIAYDRDDAGPPLVLVHGGVGDGPATWRRQLEDDASDTTASGFQLSGCRNVPY
jgi:pimeloyl-ACP methyl ester carboxylesterase